MYHTFFFQLQRELWASAALRLRRRGKFAKWPKHLLLAHTVYSVSKVLVILLLLCDMGDWEQEQRKEKHRTQEWGGVGKERELYSENREGSGNLVGGMKLKSLLFP